VKNRNKTVKVWCMTQRKAVSAQNVTMPNAGRGLKRQPLLINTQEKS